MTTNDTFFFQLYYRSVLVVIVCLLNINKVILKIHRKKNHTHTHTHIHTHTHTKRDPSSSTLSPRNLVDADTQVLPMTYQIKLQKLELSNLFWN